MDLQREADFSVLMSLYIKEKAEYFDACMQSILRQTVLPREILIVKDGPVSPETEAVLEKYVSEDPGRYTVISYLPNRGLGYALSRGVEACRYELIARMDTDDIAREDRFEKQLSMFEADPELDICGSNIDEFEEDPSVIAARRNVPLTDGEIRRYQRRRDAFNHMTVMYKRSSVLAAGNYQTCMLMEDTYLWVRMLQNGVKCANIGEPLVFARIGNEMYERRGGFSYFLKYRQGRKKVYETGYITFWDYFYTLLVQFCVAMVPGKLRGWIFRKLLHNGS